MQNCVDWALVFGRCGLLFIEDAGLSPLEARTLWYHRGMRLPHVYPLAQNKMLGAGWALGVAGFLFACAPESTDKGDGGDEDQKSKQESNKSGSDEDDSSGSSETGSSEDSGDGDGGSATGDSGQEDVVVPKEYKGKKNPFQTDDTDAVNAGKTLYDEHCVGCHAPDGKGELPGMPDLRTPTAAKWPDDRLLWKVSDGSGDAMPGSKGILSVEEIWQSITYVRTLSMDK